MSKAKQIGPKSPLKPPLGVVGDTIEIRYGANATARMGIMIFSVAVSQMTLTPEQMDEMATRLTHYAKVARGESVQ
jgi:hypothetical protein